MSNEEIIAELVKKIKKMEQINDELVVTLLEQSRYIRSLESISKAKRLQSC